MAAVTQPSCHCMHTRAWPQRLTANKRWAVTSLIRYSVEPTSFSVENETWPKMAICWLSAPKTNFGRSLLCCSVNVCLLCKLWCVFRTVVIVYLAYVTVRIAVMTACVNHTCINNAICVMNPSNPDAFICQCDPMYSGMKCESEFSTVLFKAVASYRLIQCNVMCCNMM